MSTLHKVVIIGGGPSGLTAAIYAARAQLKPLMIEGILRGGQLTTTTEVENYPGFPQGIDGNQLMTDMRTQASKFGAEFVSEDVISVDFSQHPFVVKTDSKTVKALSVIVSTGAQPKYLGLDAEKRLIGRGVSVCATCDGFFYRGKKVVVVGGGDAAMEEAIFLTRFANSVKVIHRRGEFRASQIMVERAAENDKIEFVFDSAVSDIIGEDVVTAVKVTNLKTNEVTEIETDGVFVAIGHMPNTSLFASSTNGALELDAKGYIVTNKRKTNVAGVFACGDVQDSVYRQAVTAAGTGCEAALEAQWFVEGLEAASEAKKTKKKQKARKKK